MKYIISTLGCKVNQYESQALETFLSERGHECAVPGEAADAVIINTCAVTAESGRKSRQIIRRLKDENPGAVVAVCGCYSQLSPEDVSSIGADVVFGSADRVRFVDAVERAVSLSEKTVDVDEPFKRREFEALPAGAVPGRTRAMLKIQDGCVNFCTYCIIPYTRGRLRSLPIAEAAEETRKLRDSGFREIVLTGIEIASYGVDLSGRPSLADVICAVAENAGEMRIRLGSLEPTVVTEDFCRSITDTGKICRHFHLSLQSGCDRTLKAMNRKYDTAQFYEKTVMLREFFPGSGITCDLITGFPGESKGDHKDTLEFIEKCAFSAMHVFPYSRRPGTPADKMPDQCPNAVKAARARDAAAVAETMKLAFMDSQIGLSLPVLFESGGGEGFCTGHSDNYLLVSTEGSDLQGKIRQVRIKERKDDVLYGIVE